MPLRQAVLLGMAVVAVSFSAIFIRIADAPPLAIAFYRTAMAAALFLPVAAVRRGAELRRLSWSQLGIALASGALLAIHFAVWIASLSFTSVAASVVLVTTSPIFVAAAARVLFGERVNRATMAGILTAVAGAAIVAGGDVTLSARAAGGDLLALAGAATAAGYLVAGQRLRQDVSLLTYVGVVYAACAFTLLAAALLAGVRLAGFSAKTWLMLVLLAVVAQGLGHTTFNHLLGAVPATLVAIAIMGEPVASTLLALAFFGEVPPWTSILGGGLILTGIYVSVTARGRTRRTDAPPVAVPLE